MNFIFFGPLLYTTGESKVLEQIFSLSYSSIKMSEMILASELILLKYN